MDNWLAWEFFQFWSHSGEEEEQFDLQLKLNKMNIIAFSDQKYYGWKQTKDKDCRLAWEFFSIIISNSYNSNNNNNTYNNNNNYNNKNNNYNNNNNNYNNNDKNYDTAQTLYKGLKGTVKCCLLYHVDLISGVLKIHLSCTKISESVILVIIIKIILYYIKL